MGLAKTVQEYMEINSGRLERDNDGNTYLPFGESEIFHRLMNNKCIPMNYDKSSVER